MILHHRRALIVPVRVLAPTPTPPAWTDPLRGMGRRTYDSWALCLPRLIETEEGEVAEDPTPPDAPPGT